LNFSFTQYIVRVCRATAVLHYDVCYYVKSRSRAFDTGDKYM